MLTIFFSHIRSVVIIYLSFLQLIIRKIARFTVKRSFSRLIACRKMNEDVAYARVNTESIKCVCYCVYTIDAKRLFQSKYG